MVTKKLKIILYIKYVNLNVQWKFQASNLIHFRITVIENQIDIINNRFPENVSIFCCHYLSTKCWNKLSNAQTKLNFFPEILLTYTTDKY